jgi:DHA1 family tetracycline resistance protein-like MFS transporter
MPSPADRAPAIGFIIVTVVLAVMGGGLVIPVLPGLVKQFAGGDIAEASHSYGWIILIFAVTQFLGAPVLGALSDRFGRRRIILIATAGSALDYVLMANAPNLAWIFVARMIAGFTAGVIAAANAYLVDITPPERRAQRFGLLGAAFGLGFVVGPLLGGVLGGLDLRLPFWAAAALSALNFAYGWLVLPESLGPTLRRTFGWRRANPIAALLALRHHPVVLGLATTHLILWIAQSMLHSTWVLYTDYRYGWGPLQVGLSLCLVGACSAFVQASLVKRLLDWLGEERGALAGFTVTMSAFVGYGLASQPGLIYGLIVFASLGAVAGPALQSYLTRHVAAGEQGAIQGAFMALTSVGAIIGQPVAAWSFAWAVNPENPLHLPGIACFEAAALLVAALLVLARTFRRNAAPPR